MIAILDVQRRQLELRSHDMADELRADQGIDIPAPGILRIAASAMQPDKAAALFQPGTEGVPLHGRQHIAADAAPHHRLEPLELRRVEHGGIFGRVAGPSPLLRDLRDRPVRGHDLLIVPEPVGLGKDEDRLVRQRRQGGRRLVIAYADAQHEPTKIRRTDRPHAHRHQQQHRQQDDDGHPFDDAPNPAPTLRHSLTPFKNRQRRARPPVTSPRVHAAAHRPHRPRSARLLRR